MIHPAQTSMMPIQVALARFWEQGGNVFGNYPYWYLGTTPYRYLTGPVLPSVLAFIHRILPALSLVEIFFLLIVVCWMLGATGLYFLVRQLGGEERIGLFSAIFYFFGPIVPFLFRFSDGLYLIAFSFLPFTLLMYLLQLREHRMEQKRRIEVLLCLLIAFVILLDSLIIPSLLLGMAAIFLAQTGWKRVEEKLRQTFFIFLFSFLISTLWYTPAYWLTLLGAPSLAGKGLASVVIWLGKLLPTALALTIAIFSLKFFKKRNLLRDFCFYWLAIFGFLTLIRFLSDPDFWLDWSSYGVELQMGFALLGGLLLSRMSDMRMKANVKQIYANVRIGILVGTVGISWLFIVNKYVFGTLQKDITKTVEYRIGEKLSEIVKPPSTSSGQAGETVFLSGTTAFWLNAFFDIPQVRGGRDQVSVHPTWRKAVWEVREGPSTSSGQEKALEWLKKLGVDYLVVHTQDSEEFYHDFAHPEKFEEVAGFKKIYEGKGDRVYQVRE